MAAWDSWTRRGERDYPKILATTLNGGWPRNFLGWLAGIPKDHPPNTRMSGFCNASRETRDAAVKEFLDTLRRLADQWIASGREQLGEQPWSRNVFWVSDAYQERIDRTLQKFMDRNPPPHEFGRDGRLARLEAVSHLWLHKPVTWPFPEPELGETLARARDHAISEFQKFLESSCPQRLFKCDGCGTYFVRARAPKKETPIYKGTFCETKCKHKGGARRTLESRNRRLLERVGWVADALESWKPTNRHGPKNEWVLERLNKKLGDGNHKKVNFLTKHRVKIEAELERRRNAKG